MLVQTNNRSFGQLSRFHKAPPAILNPRIEREYCLTPTAPVTALPVPVIARLDRAIQKLTQHASWIIRSSRMMTFLLGYDSLIRFERKAKLISLDYHS